MAINFSVRSAIFVFLVSSVSGVSGAWAAESPNTCAAVEQTGRSVQVIPQSGPVLNHFSEKDAIPCGSMVITHGEGFGIRLSNEVSVRIAPNSFIELGKAAVSTHRLYRGDLMLSGPQGSGHVVVTTPNGEVHFEGGVFTLQYQTQTRTTSVASFNRSVDFKNKFNTAATQKVNVGEISRLTIHDIRVVPTQPVAMSPSSVKEGLAVFSLPAVDRDEMVAIVARVFENRAKTLMSDLENFEGIKVPEESKRSPASVERYQPAVDEKEAEFTMKMLRRRLYEGDDSIAQKTVEGSRAPASMPTIQDKKKQQQEKQKQKSTEKVLKEISTLDISEE